MKAHKIIFAVLLDESQVNVNVILSRKEVRESAQLLQHLLLRKYDRRMPRLGLV
jgi:hypothetical protein